MRILLIIFSLFTILKGFAQKPTITPLDTALYRDINNDNIKQQNESFGAKIDITEIGYDKEFSYGNETYFVEFKLTNIGQVDIERASITLQWIKADENTILETQDKYIIGFADLPLENGFDKKIKIYYPTYKEGFSSNAIRLSAYLNIDDHKHKLFSNFTLIKNNYFVPINKKLQFEYTKLGYGSDATLSGDELLVGRIDYKLTNISNKDIDKFKLVFVWKNSQTGEIFDESRESFYDKLSPNKTIIEYSISGKGYSNSTSFPFNCTLDVYYEVDDEKIPIYTNLKIN